MDLTSAKQLLNEFTSLQGTHTSLSHIENLSQFGKLLTQYKEFICLLREKQQKNTPDVNVFTILNFTSDEVRHSRFLAWLFDDQETHAQGKLFFRCFLKAVSLPVEYADYDYVVKTEDAGDSSRIDIRIFSPEYFIIDIENKVYSAEGEGQTKAEYNDALKKAKMLNIPEDKLHCFYLSKGYSNMPQNSEKFIHIIWGKTITTALNMFIDEVKSDYLKWFIKQYIECINLNISYEEENNARIR